MITINIDIIDSPIDRDRWWVSSLSLGGGVTAGGEEKTTHDAGCSGLGREGREREI